MLGERALVLDRHLPSGEGSHLGAEAEMLRLQRGPLELVVASAASAAAASAYRRGSSAPYGGIVSARRRGEMSSGRCRVDSTLDGGRVRRRRGRRRHRRLFHSPAGGTARQARCHRRAGRTTGRDLSPPRLHPHEGTAAVGCGDGHREPRAGVGHQGLGRPRLVRGARRSRTRSSTSSSRASRGSIKNRGIAVLQGNRAARSPGPALEVDGTRGRGHGRRDRDRIAPRLLPGRPAHRSRSSRATRPCGTTRSPARRS